MKTVKWLIIGLVSLAIVVTFTTPVAANGVPKKIFLNYLPEFSNFGSQEAKGQAVVAVAEAWVELTAEGLPRLEDAVYEAWLMRADNGQMISLGTFNADADGRVNYFADLVAVPNVDYRYLVISVEPEGDTNSEADERRVIGGVFPNPQLQPVKGTPTATLAPGVTPTPGPPLTLPVTGEANPTVWVWDIESLLLGVALGVVMTLTFWFGFDQKNVD